MTCVRWLVLITAILAIPPVGDAQSVRAQGPLPASGFILGVIRGDGTLLPLASRENNRWRELRSHITENERSLYKLDDPQRIPREGWTYVAWDTGVSRPLAVKDMVTTDAHCGRQEGFASDAPKAGPPRLASPRLMSGIAIHGNVSVVRVEDVVGQPDDASRRVARFIVQLTHAMEVERVAAMRDQPRARIPEGRDRVPVEITTLARDRTRDVDYYFFESRKRYGTLESYANGWLSSSPYSVSIVSSGGGIERVVGETSRQHGRVLGVLRIGSDSVWVMEMLGYESDSYDIVEMSNKGTVLSISGGGC